MTAIAEKGPLAAPDIRVHALNSDNLLFPYYLDAGLSGGLEQLHSFYYPRGPIKKVTSYLRASGAISMLAGHCEYYDFDHIAQNIIGYPSYQTQVKSTIFGGGKGPDLPTMMASSLGEIVERAIGSFSYFGHDDRLRYGTYRAMKEKGFPCLHPSRIRWFAEEQFAQPGFRYQPFAEDSFLGWVEGRRMLGEGEPIWLPAQLTLPFYMPHPDEALIGYGTSGGLAAHVTTDLAVYHGLAEVIERDAVNLHWNCGHAPKIIEIDCVPRNARLRRALEFVKRVPDRLTLYLHQTDIEEFHVVTAVGFIGGFDRYAYLSGGGGGLTIEEAILSALGEYAQAETSYRLSLFCPDWQFSDKLKDMFGVEEDTPVEKFDIFFKILAHYGYRSHARKLDWYLAGSGSVKLSELVADADHDRDEYLTMLGICEKYRLDPIFFDFTLSEFSSVRLVKVFCPDLTPPYLHSIPYLGPERYYKLPKKLGWTDRELRFEDLTRDPMPYP
ncbi:MAG: hypothetical protein Kow00104_10140 [Rhodothalassiaceae bacterium]